MRDKGGHGWKGLHQHICLWLGETLDSHVLTEVSYLILTGLPQYMDDAHIFCIIKHMCVLHVDLGPDVTIVVLTALIKFNPCVAESYAKHSQWFASTAQEALHVLTEFAQTRPKNLWPELMEALSSMLQIIETHMLEWQTRSSGIKFVLALAEVERALP
ncbi:hypothetical protein L1987_67116 [Smallanthus sonchifolius]|uniref:Uncharacterized protein n=1 Tax=Smallanthus sonchifolius TaxID=185202 RepID=A0ACB9BZ69_9ASTR|nr:hypothetical protein L1987_67116 [Smallanthus sonchifolius]